MHEEAWLGRANRCVARGSIPEEISSLIVPLAPLICLCYRSGSYQGNGTLHNLGRGVIAFVRPCSVLCKSPKTNMPTTQDQLSTKQVRTRDEVMAPLVQSSKTGSMDTVHNMCKVDFVRGTTRSSQ